MLVNKAKVLDVIVTCLQQDAILCNEIIEVRHLDNLCIMVRELLSVI